MKLILTAIVAAFLLCGCGKEISLESQAWIYEKGVCSVSFRLKNHGNDYMEQNVKIVAHKLRSIGEGAIVNDIIGKKIIAVKLNPYEEKDFTEPLALFPNRRPDMVVVNHYKTK